MSNEKWQQKIYQAWWNGFHVCSDLVMESLVSYTFDFSQCTDSTQICKVISIGIKEKIEELGKDNNIREPVMTDNVNHPKHYNSSPAHCECGRRIECIDITRHMGFNIGNAVKYLWRFELKNGIEDLKKARWYLEDLIKRLEANNCDGNVVCTHNDIGA